MTIRLGMVAVAVVALSAGCGGSGSAARMAERVELAASRVDWSGAVIETVMGDGSEGLVGQPFGLEFGPDGALYVCEVENHRVRRWEPGSGRMTIVAGSGRMGYSGDGGPATAAEMNEPYEIRFDSRGNLYVVEMRNHVVRRVDAATGEIVTVAGTGRAGYGGDGGRATEAMLSQPHSIALDGDRYLYIADIGNHRIRRVDLEEGWIETVAGNGERVMPVEGAAARGRPMLGPRALYIRGRTMWIALREGHSVWTMDLDSGELTHIAGTGERGYGGDGGEMKSATFDGPKGIAVDAANRVYLVDTENQVVRLIDVRRGVVTTLAGSGRRGYGGDGGLASGEGAAMDRPHGVCLGPNGAVYVGDTNNHRVRRVGAGVSRGSVTERAGFFTYK